MVRAEPILSRQGQVMLDIHDVFTLFARLQKTDPFYCAEIMTKTNSNVQ
jgi:hypothetical protein